MEAIRFVPTVLSIDYEEGDVDESSFIQEYYTLMQNQ
jgi:hypothetical protein